MSKLKSELQSLRWKGALGPDEGSRSRDNPASEGPVTKVIDYSSGHPVSQKTRNCSRCRVELGRLLNRGSVCKSCRLKVCKNCRRPGIKQSDWVCTVCHMNTQVQKATAEWMNAFIRRPSRRREPGYVSASDLVTNSLTRNWKVSDPKTKSGSSPDLRHASEGQRRLRPDFEEVRRDHIRVAPRRSASLSQADGWGRMERGDESPRSRSPVASPESARWRSLSPPVTAMLWTGNTAYAESRKEIEDEWALADSHEDPSRSADASASEVDVEYSTLRRRRKRMDEMLSSEVKKFRERRKDVRTTTNETRRSSHGNVYYQTLETKQTVRETDYTKRSQSLDRPNKQNHVNRIYLRQDSKEDPTISSNTGGMNFEKVPDYAWTKRDTFKHITKERFAIPRGLIVEVKQNPEIPSYATLVKPPRRQRSVEKNREVEGMVTLPRVGRRREHHVTRISIMQESSDPGAIVKSSPKVEVEVKEQVADVLGKDVNIFTSEAPLPRHRVSSSSSSSVKNTPPVRKGRIRPGSADSAASKRHQCSQSDTASDIVIDSEKMHPEGDDYKLVFISSGSSKSSLEDSFEQENPLEFSRRPSSILNESDHAGFIDESDWDFYLKERTASKSTSAKKILSDSWTELRQVLNEDQQGVRLPLFDDFSEIGSQYEGDVSSSNSPCPKLVSRGVQTEESGEKTKQEVMIEIIRALSEERQSENPDIVNFRFPSGRSYLRSDSKRSSAERSIEECSFNDHILTTLRNANVKEIPELIQTTPELQQYASSILNDIFAYTLSCQGDDLQDKAINGSEKSLTSGVHSQSELSDSDSTTGDKKAIQKPKKRKFKPSEKIVSKSIVEIRSDIAGPSEVSFLSEDTFTNDSDILSDSGVTVKCRSDKSLNISHEDEEMPAAVELSSSRSRRHLQNLNRVEVPTEWAAREQVCSPEDTHLATPVPPGSDGSLARTLQDVSSSTCLNTIVASETSAKTVSENRSFILIKNSPVFGHRDLSQMTEPTVISDVSSRLHDSGISVVKSPLKSILVNRSSSFNEPTKAARKIRRTASNPNAKLKREKWDIVPVLCESESVDVLSDSECDFLDRDLLAEERKFQKAKDMKVLPEDMPAVLFLGDTRSDIENRDRSESNSSDSDGEGFSYTLEINGEREVATPVSEAPAQNPLSPEQPPATNRDSLTESTPESIETSSEWTATECVTLLSAKSLDTEFSTCGSDDNVVIREMMTTGSHFRSMQSSFIRETITESEVSRSSTRFEVLRVSSPETRNEVFDCGEDTGFETDSYQNTIVDGRLLGRDSRELLPEQSESGVHLISYSESSFNSQRDDPNSNELEEPPERDSALTKYFTDLDNHAPITHRKKPITHVLEKSVLEDSISSDTTLIDTSDRTLDCDQDESFCEDMTDVKDVSLEEREYDMESYCESERLDSIDDQESNYSESASSGDEAFVDREEELRGYNRPIDFTLHTIMEESCEESDSEKIKREKVKVQPDPTNLEKYFKFELGGNNPNDVKYANEESEFSDSTSETSSSIYSEGLEHADGDELDPVELASSRLEKYFLTGFLGLDPYGIQKNVQKSEGSSDDSQSVGSDSEGQPSPEQRRKKVIKLRGFRNQQRQERPDSICSDISTTSNQPEDKEVRPETPTTSEEETAFEKTDGQFDTIKRHKKRRSTGEEIENAKKALNFSFDAETVSDEEVSTVLSPEVPKGQAEAIVDLVVEDQEEMKKTKSRDSGFVGSCDDLLNDSKPSDKSVEYEPVIAKQPVVPIEMPPTPPSTGTNLSRKDSFNNWSSDEETNLMMSKMRAFFRNMITKSSDPPTTNPQPAKSPQLLAFEAELTRLMKTVPGINDEQVKEIVEYLSSEDTWSDSYDSSDYTSSDLEGAYAAFDPSYAGFDQSYAAFNPSVLNFAGKSELQEQISASCQEIIGQFDGPANLSPVLYSDNLVPPIPAGEDLNNSLNRETAFVYQRLVTSLIRLNKHPETLPVKGNSTPSQPSSASGNSPPIIAAALQHIGNRLVALMHEVSVGSDTNSNSGSVGEERVPKKQIPRPQPGKFPAPTPPESNPSTSSSDSPTDTELSTESDDNQGAKRLSLGEKLVSSMPLIPPRKLREDTRDFNSLESPRAPVPMPRARLQDRLRKSAEPSPTDFDRRQLSSAQSSRSASHEDILDSEDSTRSRLSARFYKLNRESREALQSSSSGVSDIAERDDDAYWRSSFESAIAADSRTKLSLEAKRRSGGSESSSEHFGSSELHLEREARRLRSSAKPSSKFSLPNLLERDSSRGAREREGEREKSASSDVLLTTSPIGSRSILNTIAQGDEPEEEWDRLRQTRLSARRRSSVPDTREDQRTSVKDEERSTTLPRTAGPVSLSTITQATTSKSQTSLLSDETSHPIETTVRSARYRPPGFKPQLMNLRPPKRAPSAPGLSSESGISRPWGDNALFVQRRNVKSVIEDDAPVTSSPSVRREGFPKGGTWGGSNANSAPGLSGAPSDTTSEGSEKSFLGTPKLRGSIFGLSTRSDSLASVCSVAGDVRYGTVLVKGEVQFGIHYNYRQAAFEVAVKMCKDLAPVDTKRNRSDPYVKVYLLPDRSKSGKRKTKVKRHTLSPMFDEVLKFFISLEELELRTLWLSVWHSDMFGRNDFLGEVTIPLAGRVFDDPLPKWFPLQERSEALDDSASIMASRGDVIIALKYVAVENLQGSRRGKKSKGALQVLIKEARNLMPLRSTGTADPLCKASLLPEKGKNAKQKTNVCRRTLNPCYNHTFVFDDVSITELLDRSIEITIWDHERVASNEFMGGVRLGLGTGMHNGRPAGWADSAGAEVTVWQEMLDRPGMWCEGTVPLRPTLGKSIIAESH